jgi:hypothetical protein
MKVFTALLLLSIMFISLLAPHYAIAFDPFSKVCNEGDAVNSSVCTGRGSGTNPITGTDGVITRVANLLSIIGGIIAVIIIMLAGLKLITSTGESQKINEARNAVLYASIGLVVIVTARLIIELVLRYL